MHKRASGLEKLTRQEVGYEVGAVLFIASLMAQWVKNLPAMQETQETLIRSLGQEDPLEEEMATHSSILTGEIPRTQEPDGLQSQRGGHD